MPRLYTPQQIVLSPSNDLSSFIDDVHRIYDYYIEEINNCNKEVRLPSRESKYLEFIRLSGDLASEFDRCLDMSNFEKDFTTLENIQETFKIYQNNYHKFIIDFRPSIS